MRILVLNAGSSSLKASVVEGRRTLHRVGLSWADHEASALGRQAIVAAVFEALQRAGIARTSIEAVGHRIVHGGEDFVAPLRLGEDALASLDALDRLAPLHNGVAVETIRAARQALPDVPHVACFDTAFHTTLPEAEARYPVPESWYTDWGIRRYGFHGLSVSWAVLRAGEMVGKAVSELGIVVAHLGSGCSVTAVRDGHSVATSMGFTPLEGLMMGTRAGSVDPGILIHLLRTGRIGPDALADALVQRSGLLGVSGRSADVRELEAAADAGDARCRLALEMFVGRAAEGIGAAAVALPRLDVLVFTGGIGEHAGRVRASIVQRLATLGIPLVGADESGKDRPLLAESPAEGPRADGPVVLRIEAREDLVIARAVAALPPVA